MILQTEHSAAVYRITWNIRLAAHRKMCEQEPFAGLRRLRFSFFPDEPARLA
jgi:hypothetical protein